MTKKSFFADYVAKPVVESRFGLIPVGINEVTVADVKAILASQNVHLDDNRNIVIDEKPKADFNMIFDQEVLCIVFVDKEGRVVIDRRSSKGWLTNDEESATPKMIQQYGLKAEGDRFSVNGKGIPSSAKTESCLNIIDRLCHACGATNPMEIADAELKIEVVEVEFNGKKNREVKSYHSMNSSAIVASPKAEPAEVAADDLPDNLPF